MMWPPADTFRHRFLYGIAAGLGALVTVYFFLFALQTGAFLPWAIFTVALAVTLVAGLALLLMRAERQGVAAPDEGVATPDEGAGTPSRRRGSRRHGGWRPLRSARVRRGTPSGRRAGRAGR